MIVLQNLEGPKVGKTSKAQTDKDSIYKERPMRKKEQEEDKWKSTEPEDMGKQLEEIEKDDENQCNYQERKDL